MSKYIFFCLLFSIFIEQIYSLQDIILNSTNTITISNQIDETVASKFIYDLNIMKRHKNEIFVYLDTPGGSVESGNKILMEIQKYNLSCIAERAYSMGFILLQGCSKRYITQYGKLMQHQISYGIQNEKGKVDNYVNFVNQLEEELTILQSQKIGIEPDQFRLKIMNEWWMIGKYALNNNCADEIVNIFCDENLTKQNNTVNLLYVEVIYSKCPLITNPIDSKIKISTYF